MAIHPQLRMPAPGWLGDNSGPGELLLQQPRIAPIYPITRPELDKIAICLKTHFSQDKQVLSQLRARMPHGHRHLHLMAAPVLNSEVLQVAVPRQPDNGSPHCICHQILQNITHATLLSH
jgi:hypothetical protein